MTHNAFCKHCMLENRCRDGCYIKTREIALILTEPLQGIRWMNLVDKTTPQFSDLEPGKEYEILEDLSVVSEDLDYGLIYAPLISRLYLVPRTAYEKTQKGIEIAEGFFQAAVKSGLMVTREYNVQLRGSAHHMPPGWSELRIAFSSGCNLNCQYCYAVPGKSVHPIRMDKFEGFLRSLPPEYLPGKVEYHGNGEPTFDFSELKSVHSLIKSLFSNAQVSLQTNGQFDDKTADWLIENDIYVGFSFDGPRYIQEKQRPSIRRTESSFDRIMANIGIFKSKGKRFGIISTVTPDSLSFMDDVYSFFANEIGVTTLRMNPLVLAGKASVTREDGELTDYIFLRNFTEKYFRLLIMGFRQNIAVVSRIFPSVHANASSYYCPSALGKHIYLPSNEIISCCETLQHTVLKDNPFFIGTVEGAEISYRRDNIEKLRKRTIENIPKCRHCILKWCCRGGCPADCYIKAGDMFAVIEAECSKRIDIMKRYMIFLGGVMREAYFS